MFKITYHRKVIDDISALSTSHQNTARQAIEEKLTRAPEIFGKPLQFSLKGLRSMRVGDYRVVFQMNKKEVLYKLVGKRT
jgi:mRNA interferase RelE/StbE